MTDHAYLSTTSVAIILACVAMFAMLVALVLATFGNPERSYKVVLLVSLTAIWATAVVVVAFVRLAL